VVAAKEVDADALAGARERNVAVLNIDDRPALQPVCP
jgi:hypothetical protein